MNAKHKNKSALIMAATLIFCMVTLTLSISAGSLLTSGVSILNPKQNIHGDGYEWHNPSDTLTLTNLNIQTDDEYGLKIPDGATVILEGNNYIKASKAALYIAGKVIVRGSGSLTLVGGECGLLCNSISIEDKLSITGGTYNITGGVDAIRSDYSKIALSGGTFDLKTTSKDGYAINSRDLLTSSGVKITADNSIYASESLNIQATNLIVTSDKSALMYDKYFKIKNVSMKAGVSNSELKDIEDYNGEKSLSAVSTLDTRTKSILFGENHTIFLDIIVLLGLLILLSAVIVIPVYVKKKKAAKIIEAAEIAEEERRLAAREAKKQMQKNR